MRRRIQHWKSFGDLTELDAEETGPLPVNEMNHQQGSQSPKPSSSFMTPVK